MSPHQRSRWSNCVVYERLLFWWLRSLRWLASGLNVSLGRRLRRWLHTLLNRLWRSWPFFFSHDVLPTFYRDVVVPNLTANFQIRHSPVGALAVSGNIKPPPEGEGSLLETVMRQAARAWVTLKPMAAYLISALMSPAISAFPADRESLPSHG